MKRAIHSQHVPAAAPRRGSLRALLGPALLVLSGAVAADLDVGTIADVDFGTWSPGAGDAVTSVDFCVLSDVRGQGGGGRGGGGGGGGGNQGAGLRAWAAALFDRSGASSGGQFRIGSTSGPTAVAVQVEFIDLLGGANETLAPSLFTAQDKTGARQNCPDGLNARLQIRIPRAELERAQAGTFEGRFEFEADNGQTARQPFTLRVRVPDLVRLSSLNDIALGMYPGAGDMVGADALCVYRNDAGGRYTIEASGQGAGQGFVLGQGVDELAFEVDYDDGSGFAALAPGVQRNAGNASTTSADCGGGSSASVRVRVLETALMNATDGAWAGTLTLQVAPI